MTRPTWLRLIALMLLAPASLSGLALIIIPTAGGARIPTSAPTIAPTPQLGPVAILRARRAPHADRSRTSPLEDRWDRLADCETGGWIDGGRTFTPWSAHWQAHGQFDGGLQFTPSTWTAYAPEHFPVHAYEASAPEQKRVAQRVLADQGPAAWPVCSRLTGLH